jgi:hypothetical protein
MLAMPMITMSQYQGPWPKCVGMSGDDCVSYIESNAKDVSNAVVVPPESMLTADFRKDRVRVFVDSYGIVNAVPGRG